MKKCVRLLFLSALLASGPAFSLETVQDWTMLNLSFCPPVQIPMPWFDYEANASSWGEWSVVGLSLGLPYGDNRNVYGLDVGIYEHCGVAMCGLQTGVAVNSDEVYGLQAGVVSWCGEWADGIQVGVVNHAKMLEGVQIGVVNHVRDACGLQIGLWNIIEEGDVYASPILNLWF